MKRLNERMKPASILDKPISSLTKSHRKVLLYVARSGPKIKYDIEKGAKVNRALVYKVVRDFADAGVFKADKIGLTRVGLDKKEYKLTLLGLCLSLDVASARDYPQILRNWGYLEPVLLGKWNYFVEKVGAEQTTELFHCAYDIIKNLNDKEKFAQKSVEILFDFYERDLSRRRKIALNEIEQTIFSNPNEKFEKWVEAFQDDPKLRELVLAYVENKREKIKKELKYVCKLEEQMR